MTEKRKYIVTVEVDKGWGKTQLVNSFSFELEPNGKRMDELFAMLYRWEELYGYKPEED